MKRLLELQADSPSMKEAQRLVASLPPLPESPERMWRVRRELNRSAASTPRMRGLVALYRRLSAVGVAGLLLLFGASAFAAVRVISAWVAASEPPPAAPSPQLPAAEPHRPELPRDEVARALTAPDVQPVETAAPPPVSVAPRAVASRDTEAQRVRQARRMIKRIRAQRLRAQRAAASETARYSTPEASQDALGHAVVPVAPVKQAASEPDQEALSQAEPRSKPAAPARPAPGVTDNDLARKETKPSAGTRTSDETGSEFVHRALRALRRDGDAALATRLLERHRARDPDGPLAEEALALQVEAAAELGQPRARGLAREYLTRYPGGRYRNVAERVLANSRP